MYDYIKGVITYLDDHRLTIECGNIGYAVTIASSSLIQQLSAVKKNETSGQISGQTSGQTSGDVDNSFETFQMRLYVYRCYNENEAEEHLYGFTSDIERGVFKLLIGVSGVGPKLAARMMLFFQTELLLRYLVEGDATRLKGVKGLGAKTAEKMVIELKEKARELLHSASAHGLKKDEGDLLRGDLYTQARDAMINLGYRQREVDRVLLEITKNEKFDRVEDVIKQALVRIVE